MNIGSQIRKYRKQKEFTQEQLAQKTGISLMSIRRYETGERKPRMGQLEKIAAALGMTPASLCWPEKENQQVPAELEEKMADATLTALRAFRNVIDRTIQSIESGGEMGEIMRNAIKNEMLKMMEANAEESESRKTAELGRAFGEGLAEGMKIQEKE